MATSPPTTLWSATLDGAPASYADDPSGEFDVAIVGAGYTGLWTALSLVRAEPDCRVIVLDGETVGFGASGRNGGWCSALLPLGLSAIADRHGRDRAIAMQRAMFDTVAEVGRFGGESGASFHRGGTITFAHDRYQLGRIAESVAELRAFGFGPDDVRVLDAAAATEHGRPDGVIGAMYTPHCAAVHPLQLVHAIAREAHRAGVRIAERTPVNGFGRGRLEVDGGTVRAAVVVLATEAYTAALPGRRRAILPLYSMMIGSEPLSAEQWDEIGLDDRPTFTSATNMVIYGQRTGDGRVAFGGRGAPYHYGSRIDPNFDTDERVRAKLTASVRRLFPALTGVDFPFHWGGPLGIARDWHPSVTFDRESGLGGAGGYAGDGVATANLAGRTLADLILGRDTDITHLPIVGHRSRRWEPEPLRWLGVRLGAAAAARADAAESSIAPLAGPRARAWSTVLGALTGH